MSGTSQRRSAGIPPFSSNDPNVFDDLVRSGTLSSEEVRFDVPLAGFTRWRIGGPAAVVVTPLDIDRLAATLVEISRHQLPFIVIGQGSNLLFDDAGFAGVVVRVGPTFAQVDIGGDGTVRAGAGCWVPGLVRATISAGLSGIVHAVGIPGTLGGLCVMNGGSQRKGIGDHVRMVEALDMGGRLHLLERDTLAFAYRRSRLQDGGLVAVGATLQLVPGDTGELRREALAILVERRAKFPVIRHNCGSIFKSDPALYQSLGPPGFAIESVGLKGKRIGDAQIAVEHANFIVNHGAARSSEVLRLIAEAQSRVFDATGIRMNAEVMHVTAAGVIRPADEAALFA